MQELPKEFLDKMRILTGDEYGDYLDSFGEERVYGLRVNTLKISPEEFRRISPFELEPVPWTKNGFYYRGSEKPGKHPYYYAGLYYLQEPSAMAPAAILPVNAGDRVLDVCAAPGGKSTELAAKLNGSGLLVANDISNSRAQALLKNLELFGVKNALILSEDPAKFSGRFRETFDKILIDAPCSGEGMFRKEPAVVKSWLEHGNAFYVSLQKSITEAALSMLKPGGMLLYSTCTFAVGEDEEIILHMKKICPELHVLPIPDRYPGFMPGRPDLASEDDPELLNCARLYPHKLKGEGHFVALLQKGEESRGNFNGSSGRRGRAPKLADETESFLSALSMPFDRERIVSRSGRLYLLPEEADLDLSGLRVMREGLFLGEEKKNRFEPSQALAMALKESEYTPCLHLEGDDERVIRYLKGETLELSGLPHPGKGTALVTADGFPLGFGKITGEVLKNRYLPGWRYR